MKKFTSITNYLFLLLVVALVGFSSCDDDDPIDTEIGPDVTFSVDETEVSAGTTLTFNVSGGKGDNDMERLTITEEGANISIDRITTSDFGGNPILLLDDAKSAFGFTFSLDAPTTPGDYEYEVTVLDANNKTDSESITVTVNAAPPSISVFGDTLLTQSPGATFNVKLNASAGGSNLSTLAVYRDGDLIDVDDFDVDGMSPDNNPYSLGADYITGFTELSVPVRLGNDSGTYLYTFEVEDEAGQKASTRVTFIVGTDLTNQFEAVLLSNSDGPSDVFGGLDLDTGSNVPFSDPDADVVDNGIDGDGNWLQRISGKNTTLRLVDPNQPELFDFDSIDSREALINAYDNSLEATGNSSDVVVGSVFVLKKADTYYIIECIEINPTSDDNRDSYKFDVKRSAA